MKVRSFFKRTLIILGLIILGVILFSVTAAVIVFKDEIRTLSNLEQIDDYGMYQMTYYGDYNFDKLLEKGVNKDSDICDFVTESFYERLPLIGLKKFLNANFGIVESGCTAFITKNENGDVIYGRNYDYIYSPSLVLKTIPENGYASISTINLRLLGFGDNLLPENLKKHAPSRFINMMVLLAPYIPFDGMNEEGVAISMLTVPVADAPHDIEKKNINSTMAVRLVLDNAANVEEAVALLYKYNIYFSGNIPCHFFIGDKTGKSVIVEFLDGEMKLVEKEDCFQIASNFIAYDDRKPGTGYDRYEITEEKLGNGHCRITNEEAFDLLARVGVFQNGEDCLQWSVLYNLSNQSSEIFTHRQVKNRTYFDLYKWE